MTDKNKKEKKTFHEDLSGFDIHVNEFGEMISNLPIDSINKFLNENIEDKKISDSDAKEEE